MKERTPMEILDELKRLTWSIRALEKDSTYDAYGDCSGLATDRADPDAVEIETELVSIMEHLHCARKRIERLTTPIQYESRLHKDFGGRYEDDRGWLYTCGSGIEFFYKGDPEQDERARWVFSRVEADSNGYYIVGYRQLSLDEVLTRVRRE